MPAAKITDEKILQLLDDGRSSSSIRVEFGIGQARMDRLVREHVGIQNGIQNSIKNEPELNQSMIQWSDQEDRIHELHSMVSKIAGEKQELFEIFHNYLSQEEVDILWNLVYAKMHTRGSHATHKDRLHFTKILSWIEMIKGQKIPGVK